MFSISTSASRTRRPPRTRKRPSPWARFSSPFPCLDVLPPTLLPSRLARFLNYHQGISEPVGLTTSVLAGFTRVYPHDGARLEDRKGLLRKDILHGQDDWLPAYIVFGEGIFIELEEGQLRQWENRTDVSSRVQRLDDQYQKVSQTRRLRNRSIDQRFVLLHTLSHLLMNRLTFECGYSSAALRERLYYSSNPDYPMAGILIYTAAGDAEGTMGGLVRRGKPGNLEPVVRRALESARWCSADPVCAEAGEMGGQGPDSLNLAACHNCVLVPETACEEFNRFLDRGIVIRGPGTADMGFFRAQQGW